MGFSIGLKPIRTACDHWGCIAPATMATVRGWSNAGVHFSAWCEKCAPANAIQLPKVRSHAALVEACRAALDCLGPTQVEVAAIVRAALAAAGETI